MPGTLDIYNLGSRGVVLDKSDVHKEDGELLQAQNWQVDSVGGRGGIRRRDGLVPVNAVPLAGPVLGGLGVPLPDRSLLHRLFYLPLLGTPNTFKLSLDGVTWVDVLSPATAPQQPGTLGLLDSLALGGLANIGDYAQIWRGFRDILYYPGNDYVNGGSPATTIGRPSIHSWDGHEDVLIATIPPNPLDGSDIGPFGVSSILPWSPSQLLVAVCDRNGGHGRSRVLLLDLHNGSLTQLGPNTDLNDGHIVGGIAIWQNRVWVAGIHGSSGTALKTYRIRPGDATWVVDDIYPPGDVGGANSFCTGMAVFRGSLYQGLGAEIYIQGVLRRRHPEGNWTIALSTDNVLTLGGGPGACIGPLIVTADGARILAFYNNINGSAPIIRIVESVDGVTWTTALDLSALGASFSASGMPYLDDTGDIYWPFSSGDGASAGGLLKRSNLGVWSTVLSGVMNLRGPMGIIRQP